MLVDFAQNTRESLTHRHFEAYLKAQLVNKAFYVVYKNLVDIYVPFLPMGIHEVRIAVTRQLQVDFFFFLYFCDPWDGSFTKKFVNFFFLLGLYL